MSIQAIPRAIADVSAGVVLASVEIDVPPGRVFQALCSEEVIQWWGDVDTYRTTRWTADLRVGGSWRADGLHADGRPFSVGGEYLEVDEPHRLVQTWRPDWEAGLATKLTYTLEPTTSGTRVTVRHEGFGEHRQACAAHGQGWESVLGWLSRYLLRKL